MKNVLKITLSTLLISSSIFAATSVALSKASNETSPVLNVQVQSDKDVYGIQFDVIYDASELSIESSEITSPLNVDVYSKVKKDGLLRVVMFDVNGNKLHSNDRTLSDIVTLPFVALNSKDISTLVEFDNVIVAGFNGEDLEASSDNLTVDMYESIPTVTTLSKNYPNPFNPSTTINYDISKSGNVSIVVYDLNGAEVKTLVNEFKSASKGYNVTWDGKNNSGQSVASGQYFYVMNAAGGFTSTQYMTLLK
tara:strand:- start:608 stop:1360 length:753 start_codon:yes stop_codon:yes gene_type:complete